MRFSNITIFISVLIAMFVFTACAENDDVQAFLDAGGELDFSAGAELTPHTGPPQVSRYGPGIDWGQVPNEFVNSNQDVVSFIRELQEQGEINLTEQLASE